MVSKQNCPICQSRSLRLFLKRKNIPIHQNFLYETEKEAINDVKSDLNITFCNDCGFIFNATFESTKMKYGQYYDNSQQHSKLFDRYLTDLANYLISDKNVINSKIVEIGCGDGFFLEKLISESTLHNYGFGFDPSYSGPKTSHDGHLQFKTEFFDENSLDFTPDVIICRHVIEHMSNPVQFLFSLRSFLSDTKDTRLFFETPDVNWILRNNVVWDFFYEHCSYFNPQSIKMLFEKCGFKVVEIKSKFNGQYMILEVLPYKSKFNLENNESVTLVEKFAKKEDAFHKFWNIKISELSSEGKIAVWGAGAKGITFVNLLDPHKKWIDYLIDLNPKKHNKFAVGTGHPIINFTEINNQNIKTVIVMNPNYLDEINLLLKQNSFKVDVIVAQNSNNLLSS